MSKAPIQLSDLQLDVLRVLWRKGQARVGEVHAELAARRKLAQTTVATLLKRLEKRGLVTYETVGRQYVYSAVPSEEELRRSMLSELTERVFTGDTTELVTQLLGSREMQPGDLARIKALIEARERELREDPGGSS